MNRVKKLISVILSTAVVMTGQTVNISAAPENAIENEIQGGVYIDGLVTPEYEGAAHNAVGAVKYPSSYNSMDKGYVTPARDQADSELCWAFSAASLMESSAIKKGYMGNDTYLSPDALGYYFFNRVPDVLENTLPVKIARKKSGRISYYDNGGTVLSSVFALMQWLTPDYEKDAPFTGEENEYPATVASAYGLDAYHLSNAYWASVTDKDAIKNMIMECGSAEVNIPYYKNSVHTVSVNDVEVKTLYDDLDYVFNHAVTLVGWDDDFSKEYFSGTSDIAAMPVNDGAWIAKNSYLKNEYFYISYEDAALNTKKIANKAIAMEVESNSNYDHNYGYDGGIGTHTAANYGKIYGAEIFTAKANAAENGAEEIKAVAFATNTPGVAYTIDIYTGLNSKAADPTDGALQETVKGEVSYAGYHSVVLPESVYVEEGELFSIVVGLESPSILEQATFMYDDLYGGGSGDWVLSNPNASAKRSYLSKDGKTWTDSSEGLMPDFKDADNGTTPKAGYVRIKAYTDNATAGGDAIIDREMVADISEQVYTGDRISPDVTIYYGTKRLVKDRDYTLTYGSNKSVGKKTGTVTVTGKGRYKTKTPIVKTFSIVKRNIASANVTINGTENALFTGKEVKPVYLTISGNELREGTDYKIIYKKNNAPGTAAVVIKGLGNYKGTLRTSFNIEARDIADEGIVVKSIPNQAYKGELITPEIIVMNNYNSKATLSRNKDYTLEYRDNLMPGTARVIIKGIGNYSGTRVETFTINGADLALASVAKIPDQTFTGYPICPEITVTYGGKVLKESVDVDINYSDNREVGTAYVSVMGRKGTIYAGTGITASFKIKSANMSNVTLENFGDVTYTAGKRYYTQNEDAASKTAMKLRLDSGYYLDPSEYKVTYEDNYSTGTNTTATMTITSNSNNVTGSIKKKFGIVVGTKVVLGDFTNSKLVVSGFSSTREYILDLSDHRSATDNTIKPAINLAYRGTALTEGQDYTVKYYDNDKIGRGYLVIEAMPDSNYVGTRVEYFDIIGKPIYVTSLGVLDNDFKVEEPADCVYDGTPQTPEIEVYEFILKDKSNPKKKGRGYMQLEEGKDYELVWTKNVDAGVASVTLIGIGDYSGEHTFNFNIESADISQAFYKAVPKQYYTGQQITPEVYLYNRARYLMEGVDYTRSFGENINTGKGTITFTPILPTQEEIEAGVIPNYVGELTVEFNIGAKKLNDPGIKVSALDAVEYDGSRQTPEAVLIMSVDGEDVLIPETDYEIVYGPNTNTGKGYIKFRARNKALGGTGNVMGSRMYKFAIKGREISIVDDSLENAEVEYTGRKQKLSIPAMEGKYGTLTEKKDYTIKTDGRKDSGVGDFTVVGKKEYKGSYAYGVYTINPREISEEDILVSGVKDVQLNAIGTAVRFDKMSVKAVKGKKLKLCKDYVVTYFNNDKQGTATIVITLVGNYSGSKIVTFSIN